MKTLLMILGLTFGAMANAQTAPVTLVPEVCGYQSPTMGTCQTIDNDSGLTITYLVFNAYQSVLLIDGVYYNGPGFPAERAYTAAPFVADDGTTIYLSAAFTYHSKTINAGRAHYSRHWWTLDSGTIE